MSEYRDVMLEVQGDIKKRTFPGDRETIILQCLDATKYYYSIRKNVDITSTR